MKTLSELFLHCLRDMYYAEQKILKKLPDMAAKATSDELQDAFDTHATETQEHVTRLEQIFEFLGENPKAQTCPAIDWILEEGKDMTSEVKDDELLDIALISVAQKVEHYEIGTYRTMAAYAEALWHMDVVDLLEETLEEEEDAEERLGILLKNLVSTKEEK